MRRQRVVKCRIEDSNVLSLRQMLTRGANPLEVMRIVQRRHGAQFFNAFLLGSTGGDLLKAYYAARETHHKKTEAVVTVFVDRIIGLFSVTSRKQARASAKSQSP